MLVCVCGGASVCVQDVRKQGCMSHVASDVLHQDEGHRGPGVCSQLPGKGGTKLGGSVLSAVAHASR